VIAKGINWTNYIILKVEQQKKAPLARNKVRMN
jgi:hypothetical protein